MAEQNNSKQPKWLRDLIDGVQRGIAPSAENRRETLSILRELEGKDEAPRAIYTLYQNPLIDAVRQRNTYGDRRGIGSLGLGQLNDDAILYRANAGLVAGPRPEEIVDEKYWMNNQALPADPLPKRGESSEQYERRAAPFRKVRERNLEMYKSGLESLPAMTKAGHLLGSTLADFSQDTTRSLWWLINAAQAGVNLASEGISSVANPDLFGARPLDDLPLAERQGLVRYIEPPASQQGQTNTEPLPLGQVSKSEQEAMKFLAEQEIEEEKKRRADPANYVSQDPGVKKVRGRFRKRNFNPNLVNVAAMLPAAVAINSGIGLLGGEDSGTILPGTGRKLGYKAAVPNEDDPRKTDNIFLEAPVKYFLGREGGLLGWNEGFQAERPDVSRAEYNAYKGYERSRDIDLNPLDGDFNLGGILKGTTDGIHGAELQFLGKNIPLNEAGIPLLGALAGTAIGGVLPNVTRLRRRRNNPNLRKSIPDQYFKKDAKGNILKDKDGVRILKEGHDWEAPDLKVNKYDDPRASIITKILGNMPEVIGRDKNTGAIIRNEKLADNKTLRAIEKFFIQPEGKDVAVDQIRRDRVLGTILGTGTAGLIIGSNLGAGIEEERRRRKFEALHPGKDYEVAKETMRQLGDRQMQIVAANNQRQAEREEYGKAGFNARAKQDALMTEAAIKQAAIDEVSNKYLQSKAQALQDSSIEDILEAKKLEDKIYKQRKGIKEDEEIYIV